MSSKKVYCWMECAWTESKVNSKLCWGKVLWLPDFAMSFEKLAYDCGYGFKYELEKGKNTYALDMYTPKGSTKKKGVNVDDLQKAALSYVNALQGALKWMHYCISSPENFPEYARIAMENFIDIHKGWYEEALNIMKGEMKGV